MPLSIWLHNDIITAYPIMTRISQQHHMTWWNLVNIFSDNGYNGLLLKINNNSELPSIKPLRRGSKIFQLTHRQYNTIEISYALQIERYTDLSELNPLSNITRISTCVFHKWCQQVYLSTLRLGTRHNGRHFAFVFVYENVAFSSNFTALYSWGAH